MDSIRLLLPVEFSRNWPSRHVEPIKGFNPTYLPFCYAIGGPAWLLNLSLPRLAGGWDNFHPATPPEARSGMEAASHYLSLYGVPGSLDEARICRLDICRNVETREPFPCYRRVLERMRPNWTSRNEYSDTGFLWRNSRRQWAVYDKMADMRRLRHSTWGLPRRVLRFEYRLMKMASVKKELGFDRLGDLFPNIDRVEKCFLESVSRNLFRDPPPLSEPAPSFDDLVAVFEHSKAIGGNWKQQAYTRCGLDFLIERAGGIEPIAEAVAAVSGNRGERSRTLRELRKAQADIMPFRQDPASGRTESDLFHELRAKVLAPAGA